MALWGGRPSRTIDYRNQTTNQEWMNFLTSGYNIASSGMNGFLGANARNLSIRSIGSHAEHANNQARATSIATEENTMNDLGAAGSARRTVDMDQLEILTKAFQNRLAGFTASRSRPGMRQVM